MVKDRNVVIMGLGVTDPKGIFGTTAGLEKIFGSSRVIETPISENAITGIALGAAIKGLRPVLIHQRVEFALLSMEQIVNQLSKWHFMSAGKQKVPIVIRMIIGKGWGQGPQHSQSLEVLFAHIPGLKVVAPSNAYDAKGLLTSSIKDNNPIIFFEHRWLHDIYGNVPKKNYTIKIGKAKIIKRGKDITIVSFSEALVQVMRVYKFLKSNNISPEVIDLRTLRPIDKQTIINSVKKTGKLLVVDNGWVTYGIGAEIISIVTEEVFKKLKIPPQRIGIRSVLIPSTRGLAKYCYLDSKTILNKIISMSGKKINDKIKNTFLDRLSNNETDIPYKDFKGPF